MAVAENLITSRPAVSPGVSYFDVNLKDRQTFRWVAYAGDRITTRNKQENTWLTTGGYVTDSRCIKRFTIMGYVPRGYSAIIEQGANVMPEEHLRNVGGKIFHGVAVGGQAINPTGRPLAYTEILPGDALINLLRRAHNDGMYRNGLTELTSLHGRSWDDCHDPAGIGPLDRLEQLCFPKGQAPTLRAFLEQIEEGTKEAEKTGLRFPNGDVLDIGKYRAEWLQSGAEFYDWGMAKLDEENTNLRTGAHPSGLVYRYSPLGELLLTQLEVVRQDRSQIEQWKQQMGQMRGDAQPPSFDPNQLIELGRRLALAEARNIELEAQLADDGKDKKTVKPHWKTLEKQQRDAANQPTVTGETNETEN